LQVDRESEAGGCAGGLNAGLAGAAAVAGATGVFAAVVNCAFTSASAAAACLAARSSIIRTSFLYGDQKACRTLMGFSTILVIVASQSRPARS